MKRHMNRRDALVSFPVSIPAEIADNPVLIHEHIKKFLQYMSESNDGSELLANMVISFDTVILPGDPRVVSFVNDESETPILIEIISPVAGDHPDLLTIDMTNPSNPSLIAHGYD